MSVVSELRALSLQLEEMADRHDMMRVESDTRVAIGLRIAAMAARKRALRAEHAVECRTDERPRFARLVAPERPCTECVDNGRGGVSPCIRHGAKELLCAWCRHRPCDNSDACKAAGLAPESVTRPGPNGCTRCTAELPCIYHF